MSPSTYLEQSVAAAPVSALVASLTEGVLQAMLWAKLKASGLVGLALAALAVGAGAALAYQEREGGAGSCGRRRPRRNPPRPAVRPPDAAKLTVSSAAAFVPLPPRGELHQLLRRASSEASRARQGEAHAVVLVPDDDRHRPGQGRRPRRSPRHVRRRRKGGRGRVGGAAAPGTSGASATSRPSAASRTEARATLQRAVKAVPGVVGDYQKDSRTVGTLAVIVQDQARIGAREDARKAVERLLEFSKKFFESSQDQKRARRGRPEIAAALAAVGDFEAAFRWSEGVRECRQRPGCDRRGRFQEPRSGSRPAGSFGRRPSGSRRWSGPTRRISA